MIQIKVETCKGKKKQKYNLTMAAVINTQAANRQLFCCCFFQLSNPILEAAIPINPVRKKICGRQEEAYTGNTTPTPPQHQPVIGEAETTPQSVLPS